MNSQMAMAMSKRSLKPDRSYDVLVIGSHCSASLAATLLARGNDLSVLHIRLSPPADESAGNKHVRSDRLMLLNPELLKLDPALANLADDPHARAMHGLRFYGESAGRQGEYKTKSVAAFIADEGRVCEQLQRAASQSGATVLNRESVCIESIDENGVELSVEEVASSVAARGGAVGRARGGAKRQSFRATMLIVSDGLALPARRALGIENHLTYRAVVHRYSYLRCKMPCCHDALVPMSLELGGALIWAWMLPGGGKRGGDVQFSIMQSAEQLRAIRPAEAMRRWIDMLIAHGAITAQTRPDVSKLQSIDLPLAGALSSEGVANRTLLIGPAGGFYTACAEETYPACWSAIFAVDVARKALKEKHLQDALQSYRQKWGSTLGDYLRGPQQNLRFLLPLIYSNKVMAARMAEAILTGQSVVR